ncbi:DUF1256 domain-containing protein [Bacillus velezensis]|uniref:DUF1256 domain-containing protein n=1 Tax=Bacillus velezensis TaxID=492670 RepID=UPI0028D3167B|nr:DUF1256 domain-containing protein [Bacillus velezensis]
MGDGGVKAGGGVEKDVAEMGDVDMNGMVNVRGFMEYFVVENRRVDGVRRKEKG